MQLFEFVLSPEIVSETIVQGCAYIFTILLISGMLKKAYLDHSNPRQL